MAATLQKIPRAIEYNIPLLGGFFLPYHHYSNMLPSKMKNNKRVTGGIIDAIDDQNLLYDVHEGIYDIKQRIVYSRSMP